MTFYEGDKVCACNKVSAKDRDILKANDILPGTKGAVVSEMTYVTVNFGGKLVTVSDEAIEYNEAASTKDEDQLNRLKDIFGMK